MRILFLSNFYPPYNQGGYEQLCREVALLMVERGHQVAVMTSRGGRVTSEDDGPVRVYRRLELEVEGGLASTAAKLLTGGKQRGERNSVAAVEQVVADFNPDVALVWGMWNVPRVVPATVECALPTVYYLCDYWPALPDAYIQRLLAPARGVRSRWAKRLISAALLRRAARSAVSPAYRHVACVSEAIHDILDARGVDIPGVTIIRNGISLADFTHSPREQPEHFLPLRLVYAGRVTPDKGIDTAIDAVNLVVARSPGTAHLSIYGDGGAGYIDSLREQVRAKGLPVTFHGYIHRERMPAALVGNVALILPSVVAEALPRIMLEAMAAGLVVIGTTTGGTGEVLREGDTGLTFDAGDAAGLARQIERLAADPALRARLAAAGREVVLREFDIGHTVDQLEALLCRAARLNEAAAA